MSYTKTLSPGGVLVLSKPGLFNWDHADRLARVAETLVSGYGGTHAFARRINRPWRGVASILLGNGTQRSANRADKRNAIRLASEIATLATWPDGHTDIVEAQERLPWGYAVPAVWVAGARPTLDPHASISRRLYRGGTIFYHA